jgi:hypothetical protein
VAISSSTFSINATFVIFAYHPNISVYIRLAIGHFSAFGNDPY